MKKRTKIFSALFVLMALFVLPFLAVLKFGMGEALIVFPEPDIDVWRSNGFIECFYGVLVAIPLFLVFCCWFIYRVIKLIPDDNLWRGIGLLIGKTLVISPVIIWPPLFGIYYHEFKCTQGIILPYLILFCRSAYPLFLWAVNDYAEFFYGKTGKLRYAFLTQFAGVLVVAGYSKILSWVLLG